MTRKAALAAIRTAGYHSDTAEFTRLHLTNRLSVSASQEAYREGARFRASGARCDCNACARTGPRPTPTE